jgi:hypothetical protein
MGIPAPLSDASCALPRPGGSRWSRVARRILAFAAAALLTYAVWRGYQNPDLLLDLANFRLC